MNPSWRFPRGKIFGSRKYVVDSRYALVASTSPATISKCHAWELTIAIRGGELSLATPETPIGTRGTRGEESFPAAADTNIKINSSIE